MSKKKVSQDKLAALSAMQNISVDRETVSPIQGANTEEQDKRGPAGDWRGQETYKTAVKLPQWVWDDLKKAVSPGGKHDGKTRNMVIFQAIVEFLGE